MEHCRTVVLLSSIRQESVTDKVLFAIENHCSSISLFAQERHDSLSLNWQLKKGFISLLHTHFYKDAIFLAFYV